MSDHKHVAGSVGGPGECGVECACGVAFDGFDTMAEAREQLDLHIEDERLELGQVVSIARVSLGLSMRGAAKLAGISEGRWRQIEAGFKSSGNGAREPIHIRPATALAVADALGLPRGDVFMAAGLAPFTPEVVARVPEVTRRGSTLNALVQASVGAGVMRVLCGGRYPSSIQGGAA